MYTYTYIHLEGLILPGLLVTIPSHNGVTMSLDWGYFGSFDLTCTGDLRNRLWKMNDFADQFIVLPSGVWNKIDAQV